MSAKQALLFLAAVYMLPHATVGQKDNLSKEQASSKEQALFIKTKHAGNGTTIQGKINDDEGTAGDAKLEGKFIHDYYRVIPAGGTILIFLGGSLSIFIYERSKEIAKKKKQSDDIDDSEDDQLNAAWLSSVAKRSQRKNNVFDRVRRMSFAIRPLEVQRDLEKERKYKIYDEMLEKYRETLRVLRKGTKPALGTDEHPAARLKRLAELHTQRTTDTQMSEDFVESNNTENSQPPDQYTLTLQALEQEINIEQEKNENTIEEEAANELEKEDNEEPEIDPAYLARRRRSSRFRKQAVIEEDGSFEKPSILRKTAMYQSYMASQDDIYVEEDPAEINDMFGNNDDDVDDDDDDTELIGVLEKSTPSEISALHRIQKRMRPKSFIEDLASIHRESLGVKNPRAASMGTLNKIKTNEERAVLKPLLFKKKSKESIDEQTASNSPHVRRKQNLRNRPKSLYETGVQMRKISQGRKSRARPASLYVQHRIQEAIPESQTTRNENEMPGMPLQKSASLGEQIIGSLHDIRFSGMTADEEATVIAEIEKQLIAQVCDENDLSTDEIKALETLLEDVVTYSKDGSTESKPKVSKQYSFTDSVSLFGDMDDNENEDGDESEETVLMSLKEPSPSTSAKRLSYSTYDNA